MTRQLLSVAALTLAFVITVCDAGTAAGAGTSVGTGATAGAGMAAGLQDEAVSADTTGAAMSPLALEPDSIVAAPDSSAAALQAAAGEEPADTTEEDTFKPSWESSMSSDDSELKLSSLARVQYEPGDNWILTNRTRVQKRKFRLRKTEELTQSLSASASKIIPGLYIFSFQVSENYTRKTLVGLARYGKDLIIDTESAMFSFVMDKPILGARSSQVSIMGDARRGPNDFKYDRTLTGNAAAFLRYGIGDSLSVGGGFGTSRKRGESEIGPAISFDGMPSRTDTVRANINYGVGLKKPFHLAYTRTKGVDRMVTPPRGNALEILDDPDAAQEEEQRRVGQTFEMSSFIQPLSYVSLDVSFKHSESEQKNRVDTRLSKQNKDTDIKATMLYDYSDRGMFSFNVENSVSDNDLGPLSLGSYDEKDKMVGMGLVHRVTDSLLVSLRGSMSLTQRFLKKREQNPRDRDVLYYAGSAAMSAVPFTGINTTVNFTFNRRETVNIDRTLSADNRIDYLYQFVPSVRVQPVSWVTLNQNYLLKFESTEFVFDENNNTLDRTIGVETKATFILRNKIGFSFRHGYNKRDTGSYLRRGSERRYGRTAENIDNDIGLQLNYRYNPEFAIRGVAKFQMQESSRLAREVVVSSNTFESGEFSVGFDRKRSIGAGGVFEITIDYVRRYGPKITAERKEYWVVDASLDFAF